MTFNVLAHNWKGQPEDPAQGGVVPGTPGSTDTIPESNLRTYIASLDPDIFYMMDDPQPTENFTAVNDRGTKNYGNSIAGQFATDYTFGGSPIVADGGTSLTFDTTAASITTGGVAATNHTHIFVFDLANVQSGTTLFNNGMVAVDFGASTLTVNFADTGLDNTTKYLVVKQSGESVEVFSGPSLEPAVSTTVTTTTSSVSQVIQGALLNIDWYVLTPNANYVFEELIEALDTEFPASQYDVNTGIIPTDVVPQFFGGQRGESDPTTRLLPGCWHIRDDGFGVCFAGSQAKLFYKTFDFGDTWTGPIDLEATLQPDDGPATATKVARVGNINYFGGVYSFGVGWRSSGGSRRSCGFTTTDFVNFSSRLANAWYGWNYLAGLGTASYNARNSSSGGIAFTVKGSTVDTTPNTDNGGSTASPATGAYTLSLYQNSSNSVSSVASGGVNQWADLNPNPVTSSFVRMATKPGSSSIWYVNQRFDSTVTPKTIPLTATDHLETGGLPNFRTGAAGYQASSGNLMRSWVFGTSTNDNSNKIHFEINPTGDDGDWGGAQGVGKGYLNLSAAGYGNHNMTNGVYHRILGAGQYWFMSYLDDENGEGLRILRFKFPTNTEILPLDPPADPPTPVDPIPDPDPDPGPTSPEPVLTPYVRCIINSEDSEIVYTNVFGSLWRVPGTQWATANDIVAYPRDSINPDVFSTSQSDLALITTSPVKFGTKAMRTYPADDVNNGSGQFYDTNNNWRGLKTKATNSMYGDISWTIEQWMTGGTLGLYPHFGSSMRGSSSTGSEFFSYGFSIWFQKAGSTYRGYLVIGGPPSTFDRALTIQFDTSVTSWGSTTFRHVAVQRRRSDSGDTEWDMYVDGSRCSKRSVSGDINAIVRTGDSFKFGTRDYSINIVPGRLTVSPSYGGPAPIYKARFSYSGVVMDSFRLIINDALYTSSFTPPAGPYLP